MRADLHLHTSASDGLLSPAELALLLARGGVTHAALTDHDTMNGLELAIEAARGLGIELWPGVELSTEDQAEVHVLGYFMSPPRSMVDRLEELRQMRIERLHRIVGALNRAGVDLKTTDIVREAGSSPGRMHVARALVARGFASGVSEAFRRYLMPGKPGYVGREKLTPEQAIALILDHGGVPVLAHPGIIQVGTRSLPVRMRGYVDHGLMGVEVYHPRHTPAQRAMLHRFARESGLVITGGSDYHGVPGACLPGDPALGWGSVNRDYAEFLAKLMAQS